jgi:ubiquinone/menaquinone biosynthesis C-methylase UbiE
MKTEYGEFAATYDVEYGAMTNDLDFYVGLAEQAAPPVVELAAGTGRVSLPIARAGVSIIGVDNAVQMLAETRKKLEQEPHLPLRLVQADMRDFDLPDVKGEVGLVIIPARSFLFMITTEDQIACLKNIRNHLREGGLLALNFFMPDVETIASRFGKLGQAVSFSHTFTSLETGNEVEVWEHRQYSAHDQSITNRFVYHEWGDEGRLLRSTRRQFTLCYIWPREFEHLLARCGYEVQALYGWFDKRAFDDSSTEQVWVARKATS